MASQEMNGDRLRQVLVCTSFFTGGNEGDTFEGGDERGWKGGKEGGREEDEEE